MHDIKLTTEAIVSAHAKLTAERHAQAVREVLQCIKKDLSNTREGVINVVQETAIAASSYATAFFSTLFNRK
jgi:hypothetical protein